MNRIMQRYYPLFRYYQRLRDDLLERLTDQDLAFTPGGTNPTLGELCREIGQTQQAYIDSFRTFTLDFENHRPAPPARDVAGLRVWYEAMDRELEQVIAGFTDEELAEKQVDRGGNFRISIRANLDIYKEALIIFYGKATVYLKLLGKARSEQWEEWIS